MVVCYHPRPLLTLDAHRWKAKDLLSPKICHILAKIIADNITMRHPQVSYRKQLLILSGYISFTDNLSCPLQDI